MENNNHPTLTPLEIINGGVRLTVELLDGDKAEIKVRQLPLRLMPDYGNAQGDEPKLCEMFAGHDAAWVDSLTTESQEAIVELGDRLNSGFFLRWAERRLKANEKLRPMLPTLPSAKSAPPSSPDATTPPSS